MKDETLGDPVNMDTAQVQCIQTKDYVVLKRENTLRVVKLDSNQRQFWLGKERIELAGLVGHPYGSMFEVSDHKLKLVTSAQDFPKAPVTEEGQGERDNRNIVDDGSAQKLSKTDIQTLKEKGVSGKEIIEQLIENSATFENKNEYSQEKYLRKKGKKYLGHVVALQPTLRLLTQAYLHPDPMKILNLRPEYLGQVLSFANVQSGGRYLVSEACKGIVVAGVADRLAGSGAVFHISPLNAPFPTTFQQLNLTSQQQSIVHNIGLHALRKGARERRQVVEHDTDPEGLPSQQDQEVREEEEATETADKPVEGENADENPRQVGEKAKRRTENQQREGKIVSLLNERPVDGLILCSKFHPSRLADRLLQYVGLSRPVVIYSPYREPLQECYQSLRERGDVINLRLTETWCRNYQVLPNRTHPDINMFGPVGYILAGIKVEKTRN